MKFEICHPERRWRIRSPRLHIGISQSSNRSRRKFCVFFLSDLPPLFLLLNQSFHNDRWHDQLTMQDEEWWNGEFWCIRSSIWRSMDDSITLLWQFWRRWRRNTDFQLPISSHRKMWAALFRVCVKKWNNSMIPFLLRWCGPSTNARAFRAVDTLSRCPRKIFYLRVSLQTSCRASPSASTKEEEPLVFNTKEESRRATESSSNNDWVVRRYVRVTNYKRRQQTIVDVLERGGGWQSSHRETQQLYGNSSFQKQLFKPPENKISLLDADSVIK